MPTCTSCEAELRDEWKYCVRCGAPRIPGAIRPEQAPRAAPNPLAVVLLVVAGVWIVLGGVLLAVWLNARG
jgi:hypothetical protein